MVCILSKGMMAQVHEFLKSYPAAHLEFVHFTILYYPTRNYYHKIWGKSHPARLRGGAASLCQWAPRPSVLVPTTTCDRVPRPGRGHCQGFHWPISKSMAAIPGLLPVPPGSTSSNGSCASAKNPGEATLHHPGLPKADRPLWASFFFSMATLPFVATVLESPEHRQSPEASSSMTTCDPALEATSQQSQGQAPTLSGHHQPPDVQRR